MIFFSFTGFSNALAFKNIGTHEIEEIEKFVRDDLIEIIQLKCQSEEALDDIKTDFFGIYFNDHTKFQFAERDKKIITNICHYVKSSLRSSDIQYFSKIETDKTPIWTDKWFFQTESTTNSLPLSNSPITQTHKVLQIFLDTANANVLKPKHGYRYSQKIKSFAAYFKMLAGRLAYETMHRNFSLALPSISTINQYINQSHHTVVEGQIRCDELLSYLNSRNLPLVVSIAEDATRITNRIQYNKKTNELIGFVLPLNYDGLPIPMTYKAKSAETMHRLFTSKVPVANHMNAIMAQPLGKVPPFCLLLFGTDTKYTAKQVSKRWKFIVDELNNRNIKVLTISSDSDPKYNCAMRINNFLGVRQTTLRHVEWFCCDVNLDGPFYVQDTPHIGTKGRNAFLKTWTQPKRLPFGDKYYIQVEHLEFLTEHFSKDKHLLTKTVLSPIDRMNFGSVEKICDQNVISLLKQHVRGSEGTAKYLEILRNVIDAFMKNDLSPEERIKKMWYSIFIVRLWRKYIARKKDLTLKQNFISSYLYSCLEINAHSLILIILHLKKSNQSHLFKPIYFSSQSCESFFRKMRSFTTVFSTVTNFTTKEFLSRVRNNELLGEISVSNTDFEYPRSLNSAEMDSSTFELPSEQEVFRIVEECKSQAITDAVKLGLIKKPIHKIPCEIIPYAPKLNKVTKQIASLSIRDEIPKDNIVNLQNPNLKNFAWKFEGRMVKETSSYVEIYGVKRRLIVKKTSLCWLLGKDPTKLSSDRIQRVKNTYAIYQPKRKKKQKKR